uniref:ATP synthase F0 subunit 8 n=1 Tax=Corythucha ciliata TaxID=369451 RepID=V5JF97_CORCT|nr:ATP synthase F0 subunit 8 [Corythucha ciliata]AGM48379.1 ATP synthase F0 subunit 8 [Corythucha ciliata]WRW11496.1 ATP synthase F0 subunit 8 [Corythucha ciliata]
MPQMSPMWWTMIYGSTLMSIMIMMTMMFYWKNNKIIKSNMKIMFNNKNWKW